MNYTRLIWQLHIIHVRQDNWVSYCLFLSRANHRLSTSYQSRKLRFQIRVARTQPLGASHVEFLTTRPSQTIINKLGNHCKELVSTNTELCAYSCWSQSLNYWASQDNSKFFEKYNIEKLYLRRNSHKLQGCVYRLVFKTTWHIVCSISKIFMLYCHYLHWILETVEPNHGSFDKFWHTWLCRTNSLEFNLSWMFV